MMKSYPAVKVIEELIDKSEYDESDSNSNSSLEEENSYLNYRDQ
jgi:hypothetical protein